jgi:hypothetical protein
VLTAEANIAACNSSVGMADVTESTYVWSIFKQDTEDVSIYELTNITSSSSYASVLKIASLSLTSGAVYKIVLVVILEIEEFHSNSSAVVFVNVMSSPLEVILASGNADKQVRESETLVLDASGSNDPDEVVSINDLSFVWQCNQILPVYRVECTTVIMKSSHSALAISPNAEAAGAIGSQVSITLIVTDHVRSSSTTVLVSIISDDEPKVSISGSFPTVNLNPNYQIEMQGYRISNSCIVDHLIFVS